MRYLEAFAHGDQGLGIEALGPNDTVFIYTWGHGGHDGPAGCAGLAQRTCIGVRPLETALWDTTVGRLVGQIQGTTVFAMQQCFAGGFLDDVAGPASTVLCASAAGKKSFRADNDSKNGSPEYEWDVLNPYVQYHSEFNFHFMNALRGKAVWKPDTGSGYLYPEPVQADTNGDSLVDWGEAYYYVLNHNSTEVPVFFDPASPWYPRASVPFGPKNKKVYVGAAATVAPADSPLTTLVYLLKGFNTSEFYAYEPQGDSWCPRETIPRLGRDGRKKKVKQGSVLVAARDSTLYAAKGFCNQFWRYLPDLDSWYQLKDIPGRPPSYGAAAASVVVGGAPFVYFTRGRRTSDFLRYNCRLDSWETLAPVPPGASGWGCRHGTCATWDGGDTIYLAKGKTNEFYAYSISGNEWRALATLPTTNPPDRGAAMTYYGGTVYLLKAHSSPELWAYRRQPTARWLRAQDAMLPSGKPVKTGGTLVCADGLLYATVGNKTRDFVRFTPNQGYVDPPVPPPPPPPGPNELMVAAGDDVSHPRWSPSCEWVAFAKPDASGRLQVWKAAAAGGGETQLTFLPGQCERPTWSPDAVSIAFEYVPDGLAHSQIAVVNSTTSTVSVLTSDATDHARPEWSLTGSHLVYEKDDSTGHVQVYRVPAAGGTEMAMTTEPVDHEFPQYCSPTTIVFQREGQNGFSQLYRVQTGTTVEVPLTTSGADHESPSVAALGGIVVYEVTDGQGFSQIGKVSTSGGSEAMLTAGEFDFAEPNTNPEGTRIHCIRYSGDGSAVCEVDMDGGYMLLTDDAVDRTEPHTLPADAPSTAVVYVRPEGVFRTSQGGGGGQSSGACELALERVAPTPARGRVTIRWQAATAGRVTLAVYDVSGQRARMLVSGTVPPAAHSTTWDCTDDGGRALPPGVYFCRLDAAGRRLVGKVVLGRAD